MNMTGSPDYRLYLEEKFESLHDKLDLIHDEVKLTNSRVNHLEEQKEQYLLTRVDKNDLRCLDKKIDEEIETINEKFQDVTFFIRHPRLFIGGIVVLVLLAFATFLTNNPLNIFQKDKPKIEITK